MMKRSRAGQRGFTLIELLVTIPIAGLLMAAATAGLIQLLNSRDASAHMLALRQVQTAGFWVSRDGLQAKDITIDSSVSGFPVTFIWTDFTSPTEDSHRVVYTLDNVKGELQREETIQGTIIGSGSPSTSNMIVARYLLASDNATHCWWAGANEKAFIFRVTARVADQPVQSRDYEVMPRPQNPPE